jgi:hypothetical protein
MNEPQWLIIGGAAVLLGGVALRHVAQERKRREAYAEFCTIRGFTFAEQRPNEEKRFKGIFEPFNEGRNHVWGSTISGRRNGALFTAFEYAWTTGGGKSASRHHLCAIVWEQDGAPFPTFALSPEGWLARLGAVFGMQDIDFADSPEFSRAYQLKGPDEAAIRALFTAEIRRFFEATPNQLVAGGNRFLFWWRRGRLPKADELDEWLEQGDHVRRRFIKQ